MGGSMQTVVDGVPTWWVNVYPVDQRWPLDRGICHATARAAEQGRDGRALFGEAKALYAVRVTLRRGA